MCAMHRIILPSPLLVVCASALLVVCASALQSSVCIYIAGCALLHTVVYVGPCIATYGSRMWVPALLHTVVVYGSLHCYIR